MESPIERRGLRPVAAYCAMPAAAEHLFRQRRHQRLHPFAIGDFGNAQWSWSLLPASSRGSFCADRWPADAIIADALEGRPGPSGWGHMTAVDEGLSRGSDSAHGHARAG